MDPDDPADPNGSPARPLLSGEHDSREALITIRAEAGGVDATDFAEMLMRMYLRWAERHGYVVEVHDTVHSEEAGITSATFQVKAPFAFGMLSVEQGTHRLARISPFQDHGRRHTSFAEVEVTAVVGPGPEGGGILRDAGSPWGDQVRSYVLHPYRMVKDLRTGHEVDDPAAVLDGDIDGFIGAGIRWRYGRGTPK